MRSSTLVLLVCVLVCGSRCSARAVVTPDDHVRGLLDAPNTTISQRNDVNSTQLSVAKIVNATVNALAVNQLNQVVGNNDGEAFVSQLNTANSDQVNLNKVAGIQQNIVNVNQTNDSGAVGLNVDHNSQLNAAVLAGQQSNVAVINQNATNTIAGASVGLITQANDAVKAGTQTDTVTVGGNGGVSLIYQQNFDAANGVIQQRYAVDTGAFRDITGPVTYSLSQSGKK